MRIFLYGMTYLVQDIGEYILWEVLAGIESYCRRTSRTSLRYMLDSSSKSLARLNISHFHCNGCACSCTKLWLQTLLLPISNHQFVDLHRCIRQLAVVQSKNGSDIYLLAHFSRFVVKRFPQLSPVKLFEDFHSSIQDACFKKQTFGLMIWREHFVIAQAASSYILNTLTVPKINLWPCEISKASLIIILRIFRTFSSLYLLAPCKVRIIYKRLRCLFSISRFYNKLY